MTGFQKRLLTGAVASALWIGGAGLSAAQDLPTLPSTGGFDLPSEPDAPQVDDAARLDALFAELAEPGRADYERIEGEIRRIWSKSGSPAMDLLLRRGEEAMEAEQFDVAVEHLSALTDHAPDFAEGWNARATAFFYLGEYSLSIADIERTLALNPRHFGALEGLAAMLEEMDQPAFALRALREAARINPNRPSVQEAMTRLERKTGAVEL